MPQQFSEIVGNISLGCAASATFLKSVEWMLTVKQKQRLAAQSIILWNWIDDRKANYMVLQLTTGRLQFAVALLAATAAAVLNVAILESSFSSSRYSDWLVLFACLVVSTTSVFWISLTYLIPFVRGLAIYAQVNPVMYYAACFVVAVVGGKLSQGLFILAALVVAKEARVELAVELAVLPLGMILFGVSTVMAFIAILTAIGSLLLLVFQGGFWALEFVSRRIAETASGPILGASVILGSLGAAIKMMN